jgi:cell division septal protein FtsQ
MFFNFFFIFNSVAQNVKNIVILGNKRLSTETIKVIGNINLDDNYDNED